MSDIIKNLVIWTVIAVVIMSLFSGISGRNNAADEYNYSEFMQQVQTGQVEEVTISGIEITGTLKSGQSFITYSPETDNSALVGELLNGLVLLIIFNLEIYFFNTNSSVAQIPFLNFSNLTILSKIIIFSWTIFISIGIWRSAENYKGSIIWIIATFLFLSYRVFSLRLIFFG